MPLTDVRIRQAKPQAKPYRMADGGGLFLEVRPTGAKLWRYAYRVAGRANLYAVGRYPELTLQEARSEHARARAIVAEGRHPAHARAAAVAANVAASEDTFEANAEAWFEAGKATWSAGYVDQVRHHLDDFIYPKIRRRPIRSIVPPDVLLILEDVERRSGPAAAIVTRRVVSAVFTRAIGKLRADNDPTYPLRRAIKRAPVTHASAKDAGDLRALYARLRGYGGTLPTRVAIELLALLFVRTRELRCARWDEFDLDGALWKIPAHRMKMRRIHLVPLAPRAVELLRELHELTGRCELLFPSNRDPAQPMSKDTVNRALGYMGFPSGTFSGHDFRATASTRLHEMGFASHVVEMQLAHAKRDKVAAAYNHAEHLAERTAMMSAWAEWLADVRASAPEAPRRERGRKGPMRHALNHDR